MTVRLLLTNGVNIIEAVRKKKTASALKRTVDDLFVCYSNRNVVGIEQCVIFDRAVWRHERDRVVTFGQFEFVELFTVFRDDFYPVSHGVDLQVHMELGFVPIKILLSLTLGAQTHGVKSKRLSHFRFSVGFQALGATVVTHDYGRSLDVEATVLASGAVHVLVASRAL